jgi:cell division protein FtsW
MIKKEWFYKNFKGDPVIWFTVFALSIISIWLVYSATGPLAYKMAHGNTEKYLIKHSMHIAVGLFAMWLTHKIDYKYFSGLSKFALWAAVPLLFVVWKFGVSFNEASRSITIPILNQAFQPSDLAKMALIAHLAGMLSRRQQTIDDFKESLIPMLFWCGLICGLIAMTSFSTGILLLITCMLVFFIGRVPVKYLMMLVVVGFLSGSIAFLIGQRGGTVANRINDFINPTEISFQAEQGYIAIATGGLTGKGPGKSSQRNLLPNSYDDFIFAILIEEYGLIGAVFIILLYLVLLYRGMRIASKSDRAFGGLLSAGLSFAIIMQAMINMGVVVGLGPVTGLPLPLLSMGGTSMLFTCISFGMILSVSRNNDSEMEFEAAEGKVAKAA